jgi:dTMP kinase
MAADRAEHVARVIRPALDRGTHVVTDRYVYSSLAYQGYGRGLDLDAVRSLSTFGGAPQADLVVLLTVPVEIRRARIERGRDRIESDDDAFHERVEKGFLELASADPDRWIVIPATGTIDEVAEQVWTAVSPRL